MATTAEEWQEASKQVSAWIDTEDRCVTTQRICQSTNLSRREASELLQEVLDKNTTTTTTTSSSPTPTSYQITTCEHIQEEKNVTVFRLRSSTTKPSNEDTSTVFALASLEATELVTTAHERDMVDWRERVADGRHSHSTGDSMGILPADQIASLKDQLSATTTGKNALVAAVATSSAPSKNTHKAFTGKAKVTTAASFFSKKTNNNNANNNANKNKLSSKKTSEKKTTTTTTTSSVRPPQPLKAKENKIQKNQIMAPVPKVGTADFSADEEESDDEEVIERENIKKQAVEARRKVVDEATRQPVQDELSKEPTTKTTRGAMDSFTKTVLSKTTESSNSNNSNNNNSTGGRQRKRRKKLVETTAMVNGYLRTETQVVWEDIPTDEEEEEQQQRAIAAKKKASIQKTSSANPHGMKQKSLMGFFAKK